MQLLKYRSSTAARLGALGLAVLALALVALLRSSASASGPFTVKVEASGSSASDKIDLATLNYADAKTALDTAQGASTPSATLPIAPTGFSATATNATVSSDDTLHAITVQGDTTILGKSAQLMVTATWADPTGTPETAIFVSFGAVNLNDLTSFGTFPLALTRAWVGLTTADQTVDPANLPASAVSFFDDGLATTDDSFDVTASGIAFRGVLDASGTVLGDAANEIGLSGQARIDGTLSTDFTILGGTSPASSTVGLSLTATLPTTASSNLPDWFAPTGNWTLSLSADSGGAVSASLSGSADFKVQDTTLSAIATVGFAWDGTAATFSFEGTLGAIPDLFGQSWLDLDELKLNASFSTADGFKGGIEATVNLEDLTGQTGATATAKFEFAAGKEGAEGSIELTTNVSVSLSDIITALGGTPPDGFDVTMNGFGIFVGFKSGTPTVALTIALTTNVSIQINSANIDSDILFRLTTGGGEEAKFAFAVKPHPGAADVTVGQLLGQDFGSNDITLPAFTITISNAEWDIPAADVDGPTATYLGDGVDLSIEQGVVIEADVQIPQAIKDALAQVGIDTDGSLKLIGKLPVLGRTELSIEVQFPTIVGTPGQPFESGTIALVFKKDGSNFEMGIEGTATIGVPRTEDPSCSSADNYAGSCTDHLEFDLSATLVFGPTSVGFDLEGGLHVAGGWYEPFGLKGLTIFDLRLKLGLALEPPELKIGMLGRLNINGNNLTVSFLLGIMPEPPFLDPLGFTFGIDHFGLSDIITLEEAVSGTTIPTASLPQDLRLENVFVAFGRVDDPDLCIRSGFFLTAELHLGGTPPAPSGSEPPCNAPPIDPPQVTAHCEADSTCLAAILLDVDTGVASGTPSLKAAGYFAALDLGPLRFDPTKIELELSAAKQRLYVSGGAHLDDPFSTSTPPDEWVGGSFELDFSNTQLSFTAEVDIADGKALHLKVSGHAALSLTNPDFAITVEFKSDLLDNFVKDVKDGFNQFVSDVNDFANQLAQARSDQPNFWRNLLILMQRNGQTAPPWLVSLVNGLASVQDTIDGINGVFTGAGLPPPILGKAIIDVALYGITIPGFPGIPGIEISGCALPNVFTGGCLIYVDPPVCLGTWVGGSCYTIPPSDPWHIPGLCDDGVFGGPGDFAYDLLCVNLSEEQVVGDLFKQQLVDDGITPPDTMTGGQILDTLKPLLTGSGITATCGAATIDYDTHTISDTQLTMNVAGKPVVFDTPVNFIDGTLDPGNQALQNAFNALLNGTTSTSGPCLLDSTPAAPTTADITLTVTPSTVDEGSQVTASGIADVTGATEVTIDWGDGNSSTATIGTGGAYNANHTYTDDVGPGTATNYTVEASAGTAVGTATVIVKNVAPTVTASFSPSAIDEAGSSTLTVDFTDPGADSHTVDVTWPDGTHQSATPAVGGREVTFTHTFPDDNPTATASDVMTAQVIVRDDDGGVGTANAGVTVNNVAPTNIALAPLSLISGTPQYDDGGNLILNEGDIVLWQVTFDDVGLRDTASAVIDWKDGTTTTVAVPASGSLTRTFQVSHLTSDDNPSGTAEDLTPLKVTITDDDTGVGTATVNVLIHDIAPTITSVVASTDTPNEEQQVSLTIDFTDPGILDTFQVQVDWEDGSVETYPVPLPVDSNGNPAPAVSRELVVNHTYHDEDPTGTSHDVYPVAITVTDDDTLSDSTTHDLDVQNVAPTIDSLVVSSAQHLENETAISLDLAFSDPSLLDSHTVTIDWGEGWSAGDSLDLNVEDEDARTSVVHIAAPGLGASPSQVADARKVHATNRYGDNGVYTITVTVVDDDTGQATDSWTLTVLNVAPTHALNDSTADGTTTTPGGQVFFANTGQGVTISDTANDPGSDDLLYDWLFGDGNGVLNTNRVNNPIPGADPALSPQVDPRVDATDTITHAYANACLYGVSVHVTDDDGGDGGTDYVAVVIQRQRAAGDTKQLNAGQWNAAIKNGTLSADSVKCYLDIAGYLSNVFLGGSELAGKPWAPGNGIEDATVLNAQGVPDILLRAPGSGGSKLANEQIKFDSALLAVWMNFADGAWQWNTLVDDANGDGVLDTSFADLMAQVEHLRLTTTDDKALAAAEQRLWKLGGK